MATDIIARGLAGSASNKADLANQRIDNLPKGINYKGAVDYYDDLLNLAAEVGDAYTVKYKGTSGTEPSGKEYLYGEYEGSLSWVEVGANYDAEINALNQGKQDKIDSNSEITMKSITIGGYTLDAESFQKIIEIIEAENAKTFMVSDESSN